MFIGRKSPKMLVGLLHPIERLVNRILKKSNKNPLDPWAEKAVASFGDAAGTIAANPKTAAKAFGCSIAASTCELAAFCLVGVAFNITNPEALICGYVIATLLAMISPVPQGVGFVEAGVMVLFSAYDINSAAGMASVLVYRGLVFWMPFLIGAVLIQRTKTFKRDGGKKDGSDKPAALPTASNDDALVDAVVIEKSRDAVAVEGDRGNAVDDLSGARGDLPSGEN